MRKVLSSHKEVAHYWVNQVQPEGKASSMFFDGDTIYSYGRHFEIARLYPDLNVVLFNSSSYSVSTAKHQSITLRAIPSHYTVITCPDLYVSPGNDHYFITHIQDLLKKAMKARINKAYYLNDANVILNDAINYYNAFPLTILGDHHNIPAQIQYWIDNGLLSPAEQESIKAHQKEQARKERERKEREAEEDKEDIKAWIAGNSNHYPWRSEYISIRINPSNPDEVQTSRGAAVPLNDAYKLYLMLNSGRIAGEKVGYYTTRSFDGKTLTIGCHEISINEVNRFAASMGWGAKQQLCLN